MVPRRVASQECGGHRQRPNDGSTDTDCKSPSFTPHAEKTLCQHCIAELHSSRRCKGRTVLVTSCLRDGVRKMPTFRHIEAQGRINQRTRAAKHQPATSQPLAGTRTRMCGDGQDVAMEWKWWLFGRRWWPGLPWKMPCIMPRTLRFRATSKILTPCLGRQPEAAALARIVRLFARSRRVGLRSSARLPCQSFSSSRARERRCVCAKTEKWATQGNGKTERPPTEAPHPTPVEPGLDTGRRELRDEALGE